MEKHNPLYLQMLGNLRAAEEAFNANPDIHTGRLYCKEQILFDRTFPDKESTWSVEYLIEHLTEKLDELHEAILRVSAKLEQDGTTKNRYGILAVAQLQAEYDDTAERLSKYSPWAE